MRPLRSLLPVRARSSAPRRPTPPERVHGGERQEVHPSRGNPSPWPTLLSISPERGGELSPGVAGLVSGVACARLSCARGDGGPRRRRCALGVCRPGPRPPPVVDSLLTRAYRGRGLSGTQWPDRAEGRPGQPGGGAMRKVPLAGAAAAVVLGLAGVAATSAVSQAAGPSPAEPATLTFSVVFSPLHLIAANNVRNP